MKAIMFTAPWCGACKATRPNLDEACKKANIEYELVNVDENPEIASQYMVRGCPTIIIMNDNENQIRLNGSQSIDSILEGIEEANNL